METSAPAKPRWWHNEDWLAVVVGGFLIGAVLLGWRPPLPAFGWMTSAHMSEEMAVLRGQAAELKRLAQTAADGDATEVAAAIAALQAAAEEADAQAVRGAVREVEQAVKKAGDAALSKEVLQRVEPLKSKRTGTLQSVFSRINLQRTVLLGAVYLVISLVVVRLLGGKSLGFVAGFPFVFALAWCSQFVAGNARVHDWGLEYVIFGLALGLLINHLVRLPDWVRQAVRTEFYIKSGLVILGANILFREIMQAGLLGISQSVLVVTVVWYFCFWMARRLKVDDEFAVMLSTAVSICGVSAAIAACGAIQGDRKKLSYVTSLVLIVAVPMMIVMPWVVKHFEIPEIVAGAWMGGTLDTSGSVVAAGALVSEAAMKTGVIVKFSQNVLLGVAAFLLSIWWAVRQRESAGERPTVGLIWERFPKFVLGFIVVSLLFSFVLDGEMVKETKGALTGLRNWWFALAFVSIGLETRFTDLVSMEEGRPALAFVVAQTFNIAWTLLLAWLLFGGLFWAIPAIR